MVVKQQNKSVRKVEGEQIDEYNNLLPEDCG